MIKYNKIHVPDPCHKIDFEALPYHPDYRACQLCHKKVYDLRNKDEAYLNKLWKETQGDFCGVFKEAQLEARTTSRFFNTLTRFKGHVLTLLLGVWSFVSKGQETETVRPNIEQTPVDSMAKNSPKNFEIISERIGRIDTYEVNVYINGVFYNTYWVADHAYIQLPESTKEGDVITLKRKKKVIRSYREGSEVIKVKKVMFSYTTSKPVVVRVTKKRRITLLHRKRRHIAGAPKFHGMP